MSKPDYHSDVLDWWPLITQVMRDHGYLPRVRDVCPCERCEREREKWNRQAERMKVEAAIKRVTRELTK